MNLIGMCETVNQQFGDTTHTHTLAAETIPDLPAWLTGEPMEYFIHDRILIINCFCISVFILSMCILEEFQ